MSIPDPCLPESFATNQRVETDDGTGLALYRFGTDRPDRPVVLFAHANGFNAGCYLPVLEDLAKDGLFFAYDARGHGASDKPQDNLASRYAIDRVGKDLPHIARAVTDSIGPERPLVLVSHSFGGLAGLLAALQPPRWRNMVLFDPPIVPSARHPAYPMMKIHTGEIANGTRKRRRYWNSPDEFAAALNRPNAFAHFTEAMRGAYAQAALQRRQDGHPSWELRCPPEVEAAIYELNADSAVFDTLDRVCVPVQFVLRDRDQPPGREAGAKLLDDAATRIPQCRVLRMPNTGHLMFFEKPGDCAALIRHFVYGAPAPETYAAAIGSS